MTPHEVDHILKRYLNDTCTDEERRFVEKSFEAMDQGQGEIDPATRQLIQKRLWKSISKQVSVDRVSRASFFSVPRVAAALLVLVVSVFFVVNTRHNHKPSVAKASVAMLTFYNAGDGLKKIALNDGSNITLYPGCKVRVPKAFTNIREVHLVGEAFFEVVKDSKHPFVVYTNEVTTKVLGTSFTIKAYQHEKEITVAVKTGRVSVSTHGPGIFADTSPGLPAQTIVLKPNQQITYNRKLQRVSLRLVDEPQVVKPQPALGMNYKYTNVRVTDILKSLSACYGIEIQYDESRLAGCTITSAFEMQDGGLYEQIEIICDAIGAHYKFAGFAIVIESQSCSK